MASCSLANSLKLMLTTKESINRVRPYTWWGRQQRRRRPPLTLGARHLCWRGCLCPSRRGRHLLTFPRPPSQLSTPRKCADAAEGTTASNQRPAGRGSCLPVLTPVCASCLHLPGLAGIRHPVRGQWPGEARRACASQLTLRPSKVAPGLAKGSVPNSPVRFQFLRGLH